MGKMDTTKQTAICVYPSKIKEKPKFIVGGETATGYQERTFQLLIRWGNILDTAETKVSEMYSQLNNTISDVSGHKIVTVPLQHEPLSLGTDDKGIYEYSIDVKIYYEK